MFCPLSRAQEGRFDALGSWMLIQVLGLPDSVDALYGLLGGRDVCITTSDPQQTVSTASSCIQREYCRNTPSLMVSALWAGLADTHGTNIWHAPSLSQLFTERRGAGVAYEPCLYSAIAAP